MGIECFGVCLEFESSQTLQQIRAEVEGYSHVRSLGENLSGNEYEYRDDACLIEILVHHKQALEGRHGVDIRFALCNPDECDARFLSLVDWAAEKWKPQLWLMTSALKRKNHYSSDEYPLFRQNAPEEIIAMRSYWQKHFGMKRGIVRTGEAFALCGAVIT